MRRLSVILSCAALVLLVAACGSSNSSGDVPSDSVAVVGDQSISKSDWNALMTQTRRNSPPEAQVPGRRHRRTREPLRQRDPVPDPEQ
jgi:hypothetical protein